MKLTLIDCSQGSAILNFFLRNENEAVRDRITVHLLNCTVVHKFIINRLKVGQYLFA